LYSTISACFKALPAILLLQIANMKKEIDAIRVKDISQGGLTQGQQTQIARNEQRISQVSGGSHALPTFIISLSSTIPRFVTSI
jgi:hypothetical protein